MPGIVVFNSVGEALRAGYHVVDRNAEGYVVRVKTARGWAMALAKSSDERGR